MKLQHAVAAVVLAGVSAWSFHAKAAATPGWAPTDQLRAAPSPQVEPVYWGWRGGVRVWIGPPPYHYGYHGRPPYWSHGRGYWHRGRNQHGWRYW